jgi:hypothetical protein
MAETVNGNSGLSPDSRRLNWELTVAELGYGRWACEGRVGEGLADFAAREVLREIGRHDHAVSAEHHVQGLAIEQDAVAARERLAPEVYLRDLPALRVDTVEVARVRLHRDEVTSVPARGDAVEVEAPSTL